MKRFAYIDIEATHTNWVDAEIIEIACIIKDENGEDIDYFHELIKPRKEIEPEIIELTGITQNMVKNSPEFYKVANRLNDKLKECIIVAHKADFDFDLLSKEFKSIDIDLKNKTICTLKMSQRLIPELKSYSLKKLCELLQIKLGRNHRALDDTKALFELHKYLRLINGELTEVTEYLPSHKKIINKSPSLPGVIFLKTDSKEEIFKTENIFKKLKDLLRIRESNKHRLYNKVLIDYKVTSSLTEAGLLYTKYCKPFYGHCVYLVKSKNGRLVLRIGKTKLNKKALFYTETKKEAIDLIYKITKPLQKSKLIYKESHSDLNEILQDNIKLKSELKKYISTNKNYLIRSLKTFKGQYQYTLVKSDKSFASFKSERLIKKSIEIDYDSIKLRNIGPREYMSLNHSLNWIKNQRQKTDKLIEIKQ